MHHLAGRESIFVWVSLIPNKEATLPSVCILILRFERLLCQLHLLLEWKIEKLQSQTKYIGMFECQWRVDQVCKARCGKDVVQLGAES